MMGVGFSCLVEESLGRQWYFTLTDQQTIEYSWKDGESWAQPAQVGGQHMKQFSVTIDKNDKIYLLAYNTLKQLIYYEWNGEQWYQRLLYRIQSRFENISNLEILYTDNQIHIFYYIENALKRAQESLIHSYLEGGKWQSNVLLNFLTDQGIKLQLIQNDAQGNLFCVYTRIIRYETRCYFIFYDSFNTSWSKPFTLFQQPGACSGFDAFGDSAGYFHLVWLEEAGYEYHLNYRKINPTAPNVGSETICILNETHPLHNPCIYIDKDLQCFWIQDGKGMVSHGNASGRQWDHPQELYNDPVKAYRIIYKTLDGNAHFRLELGDGYPSFGWTLKTLSSGEKLQHADAEDKIYSGEIGLQNEKNRNGNLAPSTQAEKKEPTLLNSQTLLQSIDKIQARMDAFQTEMKDINGRLDDFHTALYQLQDYIRQKDKGSFQREAQIRKLAFELEQLRTLRTSTPTRTAQYTEEEGSDTIEAVPPEDSNSMQEQYSEQKKTPLKNIDLGSGEVQLGSVSILINPENDEASE